MLVKIDDYVYAVPTVVQKDVYFMRLPFYSSSASALLRSAGETAIGSGHHVFFCEGI